MNQLLCIDCKIKKNFLPKNFMHDQYVFNYEGPKSSFRNPYPLIPCRSHCMCDAGFPSSSRIEKNESFRQKSYSLCGCMASPNKVMNSRDVTQTFISLPSIQLIRFVIRCLTKNHINIGIPNDSLGELLLRCTFNVQSSFNKSICGQQNVAAMQSLSRPILAELFMILIGINKLK